MRKCLLFAAIIALNVHAQVRVDTIAGTAGVAGDRDGLSALFDKPTYVTADFVGSNIYVTDRENNAIKVITPDGTTTTLYRSLDTRFVDFGHAPGGGGITTYPPTGIAAFREAKTLFFSNTARHTIESLRPWERLEAGVYGRAGADDGGWSFCTFNSPMQITVNASGTYYVADTGNHTIRSMTPVIGFVGDDGYYIRTLAGTAGKAGFADGTSAQFNAPRGVAVDPLGNVIVADTGNHVVRRVTKTGVVTTIAGEPGVAGSNDGIGNAAHFNAPFGITVARDGNIYVADTGNHTIRRVTPAGVVTTIAGHAGEPGSADGDGIAARFAGPVGIVAKNDGTLIVADTSNHTIRRITFGPPPPPRRRAFTGH